MHRPRALESFRRSAVSLAWMLGLYAGLAGTSPARAQDELKVEMAEVAKQIKSLLDQKEMDAIAVGDFRGPARLASSAGPSIGKALADDLKAIGIAVKRRAALEVNGEYRDVVDGKSMLTAVEIKAHVVEQKSGAEVVAFESRGILNMTAITSIIGLTIAVPADGTDQERNKKLNDAIDNPKVHLAGTRIAAKAGSPYAIEVLVKSGADYRARAAKDDEGFAFLKIRRDEIYAVRLINDSPHDAAVTLTVDGLSVFAFSENPGYTHFIVPSKRSLDVPGWHRTNKVSDSFQVTEYAKGAAAEKLPSSSSVGTITASFAAAWPKGQPPPDDEASAKKGGERSGDATGKGPPVGTDFTEVVREVGRLRAAVSVRYTKDEDPKDPPDSRP